MNELTEKDKKELQKHIVQQESTKYPKHAPHLFTENKFFDRYNENFISKIAGNKVAIPCHDTLISADITRVQREKLICSLLKEMQKTANLPHLVTVAVGMIYDLTVNVNVEAGLTNGSTCVVKHTEYKLHQKTGQVLFGCYLMILMLVLQQEINIDREGSMVLI